jgi:hypothetical protein
MGFSTVKRDFALAKTVSDGLGRMSLSCRIGRVARSSKFKDCVQSLLINRPRTLTYDRIAKDTDIPLDFILRFARNKIADPGVCRVEQLYNYLSGKSFSI